MSSRLMLYGSVGMGSCYFIAAMCLKAGESNPLKKQLVSLKIFVVPSYQF
jgi:hypothetical protein